MCLNAAIAPPWTVDLYAGLCTLEICLLGLCQALMVLTFIHYLKVYIDFRYSRETTELMFLFEWIGLSLLAGTFFAAWSTALVLYFHARPLSRYQKAL